MCLTIGKNSIILTADEDITCYKVVYNSWLHGFTYVTYYRNCGVNLNQTYESELIPIRDGYDRVEVGLHSFKTLVDAKNFTYEKESGIVIKCIIPKGSQYTIGMFGGKISYASTKLTYLKEVDKYYC